MKYQFGVGITITRKNIREFNKGRSTPASEGEIVAAFVHPGKLRRLENGQVDHESRHFARAGRLS